MSRIPIEDHASLVFKSGTYAQFGWNELDTSKSTLPSWLGQATKILPSNTLNNAAYFAFSIPGYYMFRIEYTSMPNYGSVHQVYVNADTTENSGSYATYNAVNLNHTGWSYSVFFRNLDDIYANTFLSVEVYHEKYCIIDCYITSKSI